MCKVRDCDVCGVTYVYKRKTSRYCGNRCRVKAHRTRSKAAKERRERAKARIARGYYDELWRAYGNVFQWPYQVRMRFLEVNREAATPV